MEYRKWLEQVIYLHLIVLCIHTSKLYKNTALLGPNVYLVGVPKVALRPQLEQIGYICGLCRSADISSSFRDLWDVCWEIKQIHRKAGVTMLCWNWPEACPHLSVVTLLGLRALGTQSWLTVSLSDICAVNIIVNQKGLGHRGGILWEGEERVKVAHWLDELVIINVLSAVCLMTDDVFPSFQQNNGSLVWCQNHKQCSKVTPFHFCHEWDACYIHASLSKNNTT